MGMECVTNVVFLRAQTDKAGKLEEALREVVQGTREEPGCLVFDLHRSPSDKHQFLIFEIWNNKTDLEAHLRAALLQDFLGKATELIDGTPDMHLFEPLDVALDLTQKAPFGSS